MKLGEALECISRLKREKNEIENMMSRTPMVLASQLLDKYNKILHDTQVLEKQCLECELSTKIDGKSLKDINSLLGVVASKIFILEKIEQREDLSQEQRSSICEDIIRFRLTRDTLESSISKYIWEIELLD